jgi:HD-like signal output (HDOD) protein
MLPNKPLKQLVAERIDASGLELPIFSETALALLQLLTCEDVSVQQIEGVISRDPALAAEVMRAAGSSFFAGLGELRSLRQAIQRLGVQAAGQAALVAARRSLARSPSALIDHHMRRVWRNAQACAVGARWVAKRAGLAGEADCAFLAGLLHDIGQLLVLKVIEDITRAHGELQLSESFLAEILETLHAEQGAALLAHWNLPAVYVSIARDHHRDLDETPDPCMAIVRLVDLACRRVGVDGTPDPDALLFASREAEALGLAEVQLAELEIAIEDALGLAPA